MKKNMTLAKKIKAHYDYKENIEDFKKRFSSYSLVKKTNIFVVEDSEKFNFLKSFYHDIRKNLEDSGNLNKLPHDFLFIDEEIHKINVNTTTTKKTSKITAGKLLEIVNKNFDEIISEAKVRTTKKTLEKRRNEDIKYIKENFNEEDILDYSKDFPRTTRYLYGIGELKISKNSISIVLRNKPIINIIDNRDTRQSVETVEYIPIYLKGYGIKRSDKEIQRLKNEIVSKRKVWSDTILQRLLK